MDGSPGSDGFQVDPAHVREVADSWDDQHHDLRAVGAQLDDVDLSGFTPRVARAASAGVAAWADHLRWEAEECGTQADRMRAAVRGLEQADQQALWRFPWVA